MDDDEPELDISSSYLSQFRVHLAQVQAHALPPSVVASTAYWTSSEKNAFFRALPRYSRLRPDLIAAHIKTKSAVDVLAYIDQLETASKANPISWTRKDIDIAFEVSDSWVEFEERNASSITIAELLWDDEQCKISRQAEIAKIRAETPDAFDNWRREAEAQWNREDALKRLDTLQLNVLESILRAGDLSFSSAPADDTRDSKTVAHQSSNAPQDGRLDSGSNANLSQLSHSISPPLLNAPGTNIEQFASEPRGDHMQPAVQTPVRTADQTSTQVLSSTAPRDGLTPDSPASQVAPGALNQASRRLLHKRIYMRRKRAEQSGREVNFAVTKLRPGREATVDQTTTKGRKEAAAGLHDELEQGTTKKRSKSGMTKPYRIRRQFAERQIDLDKLQQAGLDLFRLSILSRLIKFYKSGYEQAGAHIITSISADTIRLLRSITISFITEVIHRAIVFKNQEVRRKGEIKAWRLGQKEISPDIVQSCLEMMGFENLTKEAYFEQLLGDESDSDTLSTDGNEAEEFEAADHDDVNESTDLVPMTDRYLLVSVLTTQDATFLSTIEEYKEITSVMQVDTDEKSLQRELEEEEEIDQLEKALMQQNEVELWKEAQNI